MAGPENDEGGFDMESAVASIGDELGFSSEPEADDEPEAEETVAEALAEEGDEPEAEAAETEEKPAVTVREPPKSWSKDKHELWKTLPPDAQDYYELREKQMQEGLEMFKGDAGFGKALKEVISPFRQVLQSQGINETEAVGYLLNAHAQLTTGTPEQRRAAYEQIGRDLGFAPSTAAPGQEVDPQIAQLRSELDALKSERNREMQARQQQVRMEADTAVETFAADPANVYFNEVAPDMARFVKDGMDLKAAYDLAVKANPVTWAKELARIQTEAEAKARSKTKEQLEAAKRPAASNVSGAQTRRAPTEPKGKFLSDNSMREALAEIKARAN